MKKTNYPMQKWKITIYDRMSNKVIDKKIYKIDGNKRDEVLEGIHDSFHDQFKKMGIDPDTIKIETKFVKNILR